MIFRSPLRRVTGLGAAKSGAEHWWVQRVSAVALVLLGLWFVAVVPRLVTLDHAGLVEWMLRPWNAVLLSLLVATAAYHSRLGVQVVVEDYVHHAGAKTAALLISNFLHVVAGVLGVFAVLRVAFGGAA